MKMDIVIRNGTIVDGTGAKSFIGDVAIKDGVIVEIGSNLQCKGLQELDATGKIVAPGWVDVHTHLDGQITWDRSMYPITANGVTTVVLGNCGVGFAPCKKEDRRFLMELMEGVEDIPLGSLEMGIQWQWETFREFMEFLGGQGMGCDVAVLLGHGAVRAFAMGQRANLSDRPGGPINDPVTKTDIELMCEVVKDAIDAGAIGFSTSRTLLHRDKSGCLVPGTLAQEEELLAIGKAMAEAGGGVFELATDFMSYDDKPHDDLDHEVRLAKFAREWVWMKKMSKAYGIPVQFCMGIPSQQGPMANGFRSMLTEIEEARNDGANIKSQVFVRPQGIIFSWDSKSHPFVESKTFVELKLDAIRKGQPVDKNALRDPAIMERIIKETRELALIGKEGTFGLTLPQSTDTDEDILAAGNLNGSVTGVGALAKMMSDGACWIHRWEKTYSPPYEDSVLAEATRRGVDPFQVLYEWMLERDGTRVLTYFFMNYSKSSLDDTLEMLTHPQTIPGLGDAGAHLGFLCDLHSHTFLLTHYVRDARKLSLEQAVKLHSLDTAEAMGMFDRGSIKVGKKADINVIDLANLDIHEPKMVYDLPRGASRWIQTTSGYLYTIMNGQISHVNGESTGNLPGKLVRNPRTFQTPSKYESFGGNVSMMLSNLKWEAKAAIVKVLARVVGAARLEEFGIQQFDKPLPHMSKL